MATVKHVVLDSGAFLRNAPVQSIGEKIYTIGDVVGEIKDKATKQRLQVLPYELLYREPSAEAIKIVSEFARKTGDYRSLSAVDIRVMALSYQLEKEFAGTEHLKTVPDKKVEWNASKRPLEKATDIAGFYVKPAISKSSSRSTSECSSVNPELHELRSDETTDLPVTDTTTDCQSKTENADSTTSTDGSNTVTNDKHSQSENLDSKLAESETNNADKIEDENVREVIVKIEDSQEGEVINEDDIGEESDSEDDDDDDDDTDDDDDGWITPSNIKSMKEKMGGDCLEMAEVQVGCLTTDFAMQNVLIQMGLNVISVDGMLIKKARSYVLRCFSCMKITTSLEKQFCPHCGNKTLNKVSMTVNEDGSIKYFLSRRRPVNARGTKYKLPTPSGGKHGVNPILFEDQPQAQNRITKKAARAKVNVFDPDFVPNTSPFALNDVTSRAAQLGITSQKGQTHYWDKRNPNEVRNHKSKRK